MNYPNEYRKIQIFLRVVDILSDMSTGILVMLFWRKYHFRHDWIVRLVRTLTCWILLTKSFFSKKKGTRATIWEYGIHILKPRLYPQQLIGTTGERLYQQTKQPLNISSFSLQELITLVFGLGIRRIKQSSRSLNAQSSTISIPSNGNIL